LSWRAPKAVNEDVGRPREIVARGHVDPELKEVLPELTREPRGKLSYCTRITALP
jgi:hypothetical protein